MEAALPRGVTYREVVDVDVGADDRVRLITRNGAHVLTCSADARLIDVWPDMPGAGRMHGITIAADGGVFIIDDGNHTVCRVDAAGRLRQTIGAAGQPSCTGIDPGLADTTERLKSIRRSAGPFNRPTRLALAPSGEILVTDGYGNARVHRFDPAGCLIASWGEPGTGPGQFNLPHGIDVTGDGQVLVADRENDRVQVFAGDGTFLAEWTDVQRPMEVVVARSGLVFVAEGYRAPGHYSFVHGRCARAMPGRVSVFDRGGRLVVRFHPWDDHESGPWTPHGMAIDSQGCLYLALLTPRGTRRRATGMGRIEKLRPC